MKLSHLPKFHLLLSFAVGVFLFFFYKKPEFSKESGFVRFEGEVVSVNYSRALVLDEKGYLHTVYFKGFKRLYPSDWVEVEGFSKRGKVFPTTLRVERSLLQRLRIKVHYFLKRRFLKAVKGKFAKKLGSALLFGENWFSRTERRKISKLGVYHVVVISGMHFALFLSFFLLIPVRWKLRQKLALLFFALFTLLVLFPKAPAYRAFVSVALFLAASLLERRYDALKALLLAFSLSLVFFPHWFYNFGFWLSYLASLSLVLYYGSKRTPEESFLSSFLGKFLGLEATLVVLATISPVLVYSLKYLSLGSFPYGFLFTLLAELFLLVGTFNLLTLWVFEPTVKLQEWVSNLFCFALQKLPTEGLCLYFKQPPLWLTVLTVLLPLAVLFLNLPKGKKIAALTAVFVGEIVLFKAL